MRVRVLVWNVHGFKAGIDRVVDVVRGLEPDVLLLNETGGRWRLRRFARALGFQVARDPWSPLRRRVKDAVLVGSGWRLGPHRLVRFERSERWLPRGAIVAELGRHGVRVTALATHLGLRPAERVRHARELAGLIREAEAPALVGGDLNEGPDGRAFGIVADLVRDVWPPGGDGDGATFPAGEPVARIDALFVADPILVDEARVPGEAAVRSASDHRPLLAELTLPEPD